MKIMKVILWMVLFTIAIPLRVMAQSVVINNLEEAIRLALVKNKDYQNYLLNRSHAELDHQQARNHRLPTISGTFSGQRNMDLATTPLPGEIFGQPGTTVDTQFGQEFNYNAGISISKSFFNRESIIQSKIASLGVELREAEKLVFKGLLKEQVCLYYYTKLVADRSIEIGRQDLETAIKIRELSQHKYKEGIVDMITLNSAQINENSVNQNLIASEQLAYQCLSELKKLFGISAEESLLLSSSLDYDLPDAYSTDQLQEDPLLRSASIQLNQSEFKVKQNRALFMPTIQLNSYFGLQQFRNDLGMSFSGSDWSQYSYLNISVSIPIFNGFKTRSQVKQSKINYQIALNDKEETQQNSVLNDYKLVADYEFSRREGQATFETFKLYEENLKLTQQKLEEGVISLDNYLSVFEEYLKCI